MLRFSEGKRKFGISGSDLGPTYQSLWELFPKGGHKFVTIYSTRVFLTENERGVEFETRAIEEARSILFVMRDRKEFT